MPPSSLSNQLNISISQTQEFIQNAVHPINDVEEINLDLALDRICAEDIITQVNVPAFDNSAMDGYAFCAHDLSTYTQLTIVGTALAGHPFPKTVLSGQAIRITTGAAIPAHCNTILPNELASLINETTLDVRDTKVVAGQHKRCRGEDLSIGDRAICKGCRLAPAELGLLASIGVSKVKVQRRLRVAFFSTGDELRAVKEAQQGEDGVIFDSNRYTLLGMLKRFGADVIDLGILPDDPLAIKSALLNMTQEADAIITTGGVAGGQADFTKQVMQEIAQMQYFSINMRPGRHFAFGKYAKADDKNKSSYLFGLPGNPVSVMVSFYFLVRPALQLLNGAQLTQPMPINAIATEKMHKKVGRTEFQRGICRLSAEGQLQVSTLGEQGSGILSSMSKANCMVILNPEQHDIEAGDQVNIMLFDGLCSA